jgi:hypothetical protein
MPNITSWEESTIMVLWMSFTCGRDHKNPIMEVAETRDKRAAKGCNNVPEMAVHSHL